MSRSSSGAGRSLGVDGAAKLLNPPFALRGNDPKLTAQSPQLVTAGDPHGSPGGADAVQTLQGLLLNRLDRDRKNIAGSGGLQERRRSRTIGLVPPHVGTHVVRRQQRDLNASLRKPAAPVMGRPAGLHHHLLHRPVLKIPQHLPSAQTPPLGNTAAVLQAAIKHSWPDRSQWSS